MELTAGGGKADIERPIIGREVAEEMLKGIYDDLGIDGELIEEEDEGGSLKLRVV